jgi:transposase InsO family protein
MGEHRDEYTIREMAGVFGVSSSAYYKWAKKEESGGRREADMELVGLIVRIQEQHHYRYGSPRVGEALGRDHGKRVSRKKAARLMREIGLNARGRRKVVPATNPNHGLPVCENVLNREFRADRDGEKDAYFPRYRKRLACKPLLVAQARHFAFCCTAGGSRLVARLMLSRDRLFTYPRK